MHRAEQIRDAFYSLIEQIKNNGFIKECSTSPEPAVQFPTVLVSLGTDVPERKNQAFIDWSLTIYTDVYGRDAVGDIDAEILGVIEQLHIAILSNTTLGLDYVSDIIPAGQEEPERSSDGDSYSISARVGWVVKYRTPLSNPSV